MNKKKILLAIIATMLLTTCGCTNIKSNTQLSTEQQSISEISNSTTSNTDVSNEGNTINNKEKFEKQDISFEYSKDIWNDINLGLNSEKAKQIAFVKTTNNGAALMLIIQSTEGLSEDEYNNLAINTAKAKAEQSSFSSEYKTINGYKVNEIHAKTNSGTDEGDITENIFVHNGYGYIFSLVSVNGKVTDADYEESIKIINTVKFK